MAVARLAPSLPRGVYGTTTGTPAPSFQRRRESSNRRWLLYPVSLPGGKGSWLAGTVPPCPLAGRAPLPSGEGNEEKEPPGLLDSRLRGNDGCRGREGPRNPT